MAELAPIAWRLQDLVGVPAAVILPKELDENFGLKSARTQSGRPAAVGVEKGKKRLLRDRVSMVVETTLTE